VNVGIDNVHSVFILKRRIRSFPRGDSSSARAQRDGCRINPGLNYRGSQQMPFELRTRVEPMPELDSETLMFCVSAAYLAVNHPNALLAFGVWEAVKKQSDVCPRLMLQHQLGR
jgi:hypothetical protein